MWKFDKSAIERFNSLMSIVSPSMNEIDMAVFLKDFCDSNGVLADIDVMGNLYATQKGKKDIDVAICAHMDTVAVQITKILPNGMLQFRRIGVSPHVLLGQKLIIKSSKGTVHGVVGFDPTSQYAQPKGLVEEDLWIDICVSSREEAEKIVSIGDLAVINSDLTIINDDFLCGSFLDDRIGIFVMQECMRWYKDKDVPVNVHFVATVQEEVGLRGSRIIAAGNKYDVCIVLDVDYATDTLASHENQMGTLKLGSGAGLQIKADNNLVLRRIAIEYAEEQDIKYQISLGRFLYGGTDASSVQLAGKGVATINVSIPCRYMHSPIEICQKKDVEAVVNLLIGIVEQIGLRSSDTFIPGID